MSHESSGLKKRTIKREQVEELCGKEIKTEPFWQIVKGSKTEVVRVFWEITSGLKNRKQVVEVEGDMRMMITL